MFASMRRGNDPKRQAKWLNSESAKSRSEPSKSVEASARVRCVRTRAEFLNSTEEIGTGVIIQTGLVVTNWHLGDRNNLTKILINDREAQLVHFDIRLDLAAYKVHTQRLRMIVFRNKVMQGDQVFYIGNPEGWNKTFCKGTVTKVSNAGKRIYSSTPPAAGMSGSGLYHEKDGSLVGIIDSMDGSGANNNCNFTIAVPAKEVERFVREAQARLRMNSWKESGRKVIQKREDVLLDFEEREYE